MIKEVIKDLAYFLAYFLLVLTIFSCIFSGLGITLSTNYGLGDAGFLISTLRTSLGDFEIVDDFDSDSPTDTLLVLRWLSWVLAVFLLALIFLNFIIAVISESYEKVMGKQLARSYQEKVSLIRKREVLLSKDELDNEKYFPRYLIVRKPYEYDNDRN